MVASYKVDTAFWAGRKVLLTGHTGFKGSWLAIWLETLGAKVCGFSLAPKDEHCLYNQSKVPELLDSHIGDILDMPDFKRVASEFEPEIVLHLAAQSLVRYSYRHPVETFQTNVMGTINVLEVIRELPSVKSVVIVTSDKCYENKEWEWGYRESDPMGGHDPYSASKGCAELVVSSYRNSFFSSDHRVGIASARAGNVIGGGDYAEDRLIPSFFEAIRMGETLRVRSPNAVRPWQHVLEPLSGYLMLAQALFDKPHEYGQAWNFGPAASDTLSVESVLNAFEVLWGEGATWATDTNSSHPHEAGLLKLDSSLAHHKLGWSSTWRFTNALAKTVEWYKRSLHGDDPHELCCQQINAYMSE